MAGEAKTIARPYAEAVFRRALETDKLDLWSEMLGLLAAIVDSGELRPYLNSPALDRARLIELLLEIGGGRLSDEGQNFVRILVQNDRLLLLPEITLLYQQLRNEHEGTLDVLVESAYALQAAERNQLAAALKARLGRDVRVTSEKNPELIGGLRIRAGDLVIDASVAGQLSRLANELGI